MWYIFLSNIIFFPQIIYFLSCNKDKNLTPYLGTHISFWWLYSCLGDWCNSVLNLHLTLIMMRCFFSNLIRCIMSRTQNQPPLTRKKRTLMRLPRKMLTANTTFSLPFLLILPPLPLLFIFFSFLFFTSSSSPSSSHPASSSPSSSSSSPSSSSSLLLLLVLLVQKQLC